MTISDAITKRISDLIHERGTNIKVAAENGGLTPSTLSSIMSKKSLDPKLSTLYQIALSFNMTVSELLDFPEMNETLFDDE